jgi:hypothetical protein
MIVRVSKRESVKSNPFKSCEEKKDA